jgi:hypothetical protein
MLRPLGVPPVEKTRLVLSIRALKLMRLIE